MVFFFVIVLLTSVSFGQNKFYDNISKKKPDVQSKVLEKRIQLTISEKNYFNLESDLNFYEKLDIPVTEKEEFLLGIASTAKKDSQIIAILTKLDAIKSKKIPFSLLLSLTNNSENNYKPETLLKIYEILDDRAYFDDILQNQGKAAKLLKLSLNGYDIRTIESAFRVAFRNNLLETTREILPSLEKSDNPRLTLFKCFLLLTEDKFKETKECVAPHQSVWKDIVELFLLRIQKNTSDKELKKSFQKVNEKAISNNQHKSYSYLKYEAFLTKTLSKNSLEYLKSQPPLHYIDTFTLLKLNEKYEFLPEKLSTQLREDYNKQFEKTYLQQFLIPTASNDWKKVFIPNSIERLSW